MIVEMIVMNSSDWTRTSDLAVNSPASEAGRRFSVELYGINYPHKRRVVVGLGVGRG